MTGLQTRSLNRPLEQMIFRVKDPVIEKTGLDRLGVRRLATPNNGSQVVRGGRHAPLSP